MAVTYERSTSSACGIVGSLGAGWRGVVSWQAARGLAGRAHVRLCLVRSLVTSASAGTLNSVCIVGVPGPSAGGCGGRTRHATPSGGVRDTRHLPRTASRAADRSSAIVEPRCPPALAAAAVSTVHQLCSVLQFHYAITTPAGIWWPRLATIYER